MARGGGEEKGDAGTALNASTQPEELRMSAMAILDSNASDGAAACSTRRTMHVPAAAAAKEDLEVQPTPGQP